LQLFTSFVQDEITLKPDRLYLTLGAKLEHNDFSGFEFEPSARIAWSVSRNDTLWAAFSRARGTPSPADRGIDYSLAAFPGPGGVPVLETVQGNPNTLSENLDALEAGYRAQLRGNISLDLSTYYNWYGDLTTYEPVSPFLDLNPPPPHLNVPIAFANQMHGQTLGLEMAVNWKITNRWTLSPGYAFEKLHMHLAPTSQDTTSVGAVEGSSPDHSAQLRSHLVLWHGLGWDTSAYFVGRLTDPSEASYTRLDTGLSWHFSEGASLSFVGQNLLRDRHEEFVDSPPSANTTTLVKRSAYVRLRWQF
jgi:iron complex outermembrane receptor protein